ncbi:nuclear transport factor 2 family protein [Mesorhizobium sp. LHD-90]|uniref:nuclear transport factor 2 family protein n=1 Tax=Mesorhizobium sp. LHD-90 TaxID=3071414 RepID=UPI0027DECED6|nr:nuclear transport factor 2 family protein [Mesorhizobium sp. LHD-90]MDQ6435950.1 nuclear transport factor 2 family protein [Mesorhizobium sp. LHD-90]
MSDPVDVLRRFHDAVNEQDYAVIEDFFADDATYGSQKVGALEGKAAIMAAFHKYFDEYPDQVAHDDSFTKLSETSAKSSWHLEATSATTGEKLIRKGEETIFLNAEGKIERVDVRDI